MDPKLLNIIACPVCKGPLHFNQTQHELICTIDHLAFPIVDDIPVLIVSEARSLEAHER